MSNPIEVETNIQIFRLHKIDNSSEELTVDFGITFMWKDPYLAEKANGINFTSHPSIFLYKNDPNIIYKEFRLWPSDLELGVSVFDPAWKIQNASSFTIIKSISLLKDPSSGLVHNFIHLNAIIHHTLDMRSFPFDSQDFSIVLRSEHPKNVMKFCPFQDKRKTKVFDPVTSEWLITGEIELDFSESKNDNNQARAASGTAYASMSFKFSAQRKPEWYIINIVLTSFLIVVSSFSVFFVDPSNLAERLSIPCTAWLLLISLKFIISDHLPKISYLTTLDRYLLVSYGLMLALVGWACLAPSCDRSAPAVVLPLPLAEPLSLRPADAAVLLAASALWTSVHACLAAVYLRRNLRIDSLAALAAALRQSPRSLWPLLLAGCLWIAAHVVAAAHLGGNHLRSAWTAAAALLDAALSAAAAGN